MLEGGNTKPGDDFEIPVTRDPASSQKRFLAASARGPLGPEDYACEYLLVHGAACCYKTQNDCWEVLAKLIAGPLTGTVPLTNGYYLCSGYERLDRTLSERQYDAFLKQATKKLGKRKAVAGAWSRYRKELELTLAGRRLLATRSAVLDGFFAELLPHFTDAQAVAIAHLSYTNATGLSLRGLPDLTVLDASGAHFVEVKSPGDRVSDIQEAVHAYLYNVGLPVLTCRLAEASVSPPTGVHQ